MKVQLWANDMRSNKILLTSLPIALLKNDR